MNKKNYYQILGVEPSASAYEIKAAYRKLALIYHPDKNANDLIAESVFKEINEAYTVLSHKQQRAAYHRTYTEFSHNSPDKGTPFFSTELLQLRVVKLQKAVREADPYRMNTAGIFHELQTLFSAFHLAVVQKENNIKLNNEIVMGCLYILGFLPGHQQKAVLTDLATLPHERHREIAEFEKKQRTRLFLEKYKIWLVLILSAIICFALYRVISGR